jgi:predicted dithiol-disulfide oxidoreductase (DUF899 family)
MALPNVATREAWVAARKALLAKEKELTHARDALSTERRLLPMVRMDKPYVFHGPEGDVGLAGLFQGRRQLIVQHFMFKPEWTDGCPSCSAACDELSDGLLAHLHERDTSFVAVSRAPFPKLQDYKERKGWRFPWYSSFGGDFNYDFHVTLDESVAPIEYNFRTKEEFEARGEADFLKKQPVEMPGYSCFLRDGDQVFHTYSMYARGAESLGGGYYFLDLTALGRQEDWEEPKGRADLARRGVPEFSPPPVKLK